MLPVLASGTKDLPGLCLGRWPSFCDRPGGVQWARHGAHLHFEIREHGLAIDPMGPLGASQLLRTSA